MEKRSKVTIFSILGLALGLRLISLNQSFWMDEAISATIAKNFSFFGIVTKFITSDTHPPFYYLFLHLWSLIFGYSEIAIRLPSVLFGVLTVYVVYKIGKFFSKEVASVSALLMATAPLHIYYSQEARMYSLTVLLVSLSVYLFLMKKWFILSFPLLLLGMTDYLPLLIMIPFWIYILFIDRNKKSLIDFVKAHIPLIGFLIIWMPYFIKQTTSTSAYLLEFPAWKSVLGSASVNDLALVWVKFIIGRVSFDNKMFYLALILTISIPFIYLLKQALRKEDKLIFVWIWFLVPISLAFIGAFFVPGFTYFRLIFVLPAFYLLLSYGLSKIRVNNYLRIFIILLNISFSLIYLFNSTFWREDWKNAVPFVENRLRDDQIVLVSYSEPFTPYMWYSKKQDRTFSFESQKYVNSSSVYTLDYLMDLTDPSKENYEKLVNLGFTNKEVYNFRGIGQVRYWVKH